MEMIVTFPGGARVDASFGNFTVGSDQPVQGGGEGSAPTPFDLFLASIGTCAGIYVLGFCRQRGLPTDGISIVEKIHHNPATGMIDQLDIEIKVPPSFPEKYYDSLVRSAELCKVKKHIEQPPVFKVYTSVEA